MVEAEFKTFVDSSTGEIRLVSEESYPEDSYRWVNSAGQEATFEHLRGLHRFIVVGRLKEDTKSWQ